MNELCSFGESLQTQELSSDYRCRSGSLSNLSTASESIATSPKAVMTSLFRATLLPIFTIFCYLFLCLFSCSSAPSLWGITSV